MSSLQPISFDIQSEIEEAIEDYIANQDEYYLEDDSNPYADYVKTLGYGEADLDDIIKQLGRNRWSESNLELLKEIDEKELYNILDYVGEVKLYRNHSPDGIFSIGLGEVEIDINHILDEFVVKYPNINLGYGTIAYCSLEGYGWSLQVEEEAFERYIDHHIDSLEPILGLIDPRGWVRKRFEKKYKEAV